MIVLMKLREWNQLYHSKVVKGCKIGRPQVCNQLELKFSLLGVVLDK